MTQILHKYWFCTLKRLRRTWPFSFSSLMCLAVCSPPWSCLHSWTSFRLPTLPDLEGGGGHRKGGEEGADLSSPQAGLMAMTAALPVKKGHLHVGWSSPPCSSSLSCGICSQVAAPKWFFFEEGMMSCCCLSRLGHLAALPGNTGQCHGCCHHENTALSVPNCRATVVSEDPCQSHFWHPLLRGQYHHNQQNCWWAVPPHKGQLGVCRDSCCVFLL